MSARRFFAWRMLETARVQDKHQAIHVMNRDRAKARAASDPLADLTDNEFKKKYRFTKEQFGFLCKELRLYSSLRSSQRVPLEVKVLTALFFYASGSYQRPVGVAKNLSQKMCSIYIEEVTQALTHKDMVSKYIKFPDSPGARQAIIQRFYAKYGIPGIIGCIDGSHFRIFGPPKAEEHWYYCRKHYHSLNVQMVCDDEYRILNVNAKFGGSNHDAFIWENSNLNTYMQSLNQNGEVVWLLRDSGYPQRPWLMTPITGPAPHSPEAYYNDKHCAARVVIENTFGRLKNRWRCLNKDRVLHYRPVKCARIIQACCVLHNMGMSLGITETEETMGGLEHDEDLQAGNEVTERSATTDLIRGRSLRDQLVRRLQQ